jgi:hypothetical protein
MNGFLVMINLLSRNGFFFMATGMLFVFHCALQNGKKMIGEGKLKLQIVWDGRHICAVTVHSMRPILACRMFEGRPGAQVLSGISLLYGICGRAQTVAAAAALECAADRPAHVAVGRLRELAVVAECAQEHLWRLLVDLPVLLGESALVARFVPMRQRFEDLRARAGTDWWKRIGSIEELRAWRVLADDLDAFLESELFGMAPARFLELANEDDLAAWMRGGRGLAAPLLARLQEVAPARDENGDVTLFALPSAQVLTGSIAAAIAASDAFVAAPELAGAPAEGGALAREAGMPALAARLARRGRSVGLRVFARLVELARLGERMRAISRGLQSVSWLCMGRDDTGAGLAAVETARGVLIHRAELEGERVRRYRIVAPTEWNFHPRGAFVRGLTGLSVRARSEARRAAALLAHALDPCVAYELNLETVAGRS